ncbi:MAG: phosphodiester glycosidase family protein [Lentisphaeria bacterium]|nr:phosphodiester glycosidase family protein [Lentisphaeria bacterium]
MKKIIVILLSLCAVVAFAEMRLDGKFNWQNQEVKKLHEGIYYYTMELTSPRIIKLAVMKIDLNNPKLRFKVTSKAELWGKSMEELPQFTIQTERESARKFMQKSLAKNENMIAAINSSPWVPWQKPWNHRYAEIHGLVISDGVVVSDLRKNAPSFIVRNNGDCELASLDAKADLSSIKHAVSGFEFVLQNGKITVPQNQYLAPRTGFGLSADNKVLYWLVIDGRQENYSMGCSTDEVGELLKFFGSDDGVNMDGGGSTTLLIRENGEIKKLNHHKNDAERSIAVTVGIILEP